MGKKQPASNIGAVPQHLNVRHEKRSKNEIVGTVAQHLISDVNIAVLSDAHIEPEWQGNPLALSALIDNQGILNPNIAP